MRASTHIHTHTHIYTHTETYSYVCVSMCGCVKVRLAKQTMIGDFDSQEGAVPQQNCD